VLKSLPDFVPVYSSGGCGGFSPPSMFPQAGNLQVLDLLKNDAIAKL
jgi:hypothetical protein